MSVTGQESLVIPPDHPLAAFKFNVKLSVVTGEGVRRYQANDTSKEDCGQVRHSFFFFFFNYMRQPISGSSLFVEINSEIFTRKGIKFIASGSVSMKIMSSI